MEPPVCLAFMLAGQGVTLMHHLTLRVPWHDSKWNGCVCPLPPGTHVAAKPSGYRDWPNVGEWLRQAASAVCVDELASELHGRSVGSCAGAAYLLDLGGAGVAARELIARAPSGSGPYYFGDRSRPGRHNRAYDVIDSTGISAGRAAAGAGGGE